MGKPMNKDRQKQQLDRAFKEIAKLKREGIEEPSEIKRLHACGGGVPFAVA